MRSSRQQTILDQLPVAILIVDAFHELEQPVALLKNLARTLKPSGVIGIINFISLTLRMSTTCS